MNVSYLLVIIFIFVLSNQVNSNQLASKFFSDPDLINAKLTPNGNRIALVRGAAKSQTLNIFDINKNTEYQIFNVNKFSKKEAFIQSIQWIDDNYLAVQYAESKKGITDLLDTKLSRYLLVIVIPDNIEDIIIKKVRTKGWLIDPLVKEKNVFLYAKRGGLSKVYRVRPSELQEYNAKLNKLTKIDGGQFIAKNEVASIKGYVYQWFSNTNGKIKAALHYNQANSSVDLSIFKEAASEVIKSWPLAEINQMKDEKLNVKQKLLLPIAIADQDNTFYCFDYNEDIRRSVYKYNFSDSKQKLIYKANAFSLTRIILSKTNSELIGVEVLKDGDLVVDYLSSDFDLKHKEAKFTRIVDFSLNEKIILIFSKSDTNPGQYHLQDIEKNKKTLIGSRAPQLVGHITSYQIEDVHANKGLSIPYLLTLPQRGETTKAWPLIVLSHGGPFYVYDERYYDPITQYLSASGYAVLRVNFRGSGGYNDDFVNAGKKEWGNLMLSDIAKITSFISKRPDIDEQKICAFGISYGGYASTMLAINKPDIFKCAASIAGVMDVNLLLNEWNGNEKQEMWEREFWGDSYKEYEQIKALSPLFLAEKLNRPLYIIHGDQDKVVSVEHAHRMKLILSMLDRPFNWLILEGEGHHLKDKNNRIKAFSSSVNFFNQYLSM